MQAYAWYGIAAASGYDWAPELRDEVADYLTADKLEQAQSLARALYRQYAPREPVLTRQAHDDSRQAPASGTTEVQAAPAATRGRFGFSLRPPRIPAGDDEVQDS